MADPRPLAQLSDDTELMADFIVESREHLAAIERKLLVLEKDSSQADAIHSIFRGFHTIKGLAGFLELAAMREVAHEIETALDLARQGKLRITAAVIDVILESVDFLGRGIGEFEAGRSAESDASRETLVARIHQLVAKDGSQIPAREAAATSHEDRCIHRTPEKFSVRVDSAKLDSLMDMVGELVIAQSLVCHNPEMATADPRLQRELAQLADIAAQVQRAAMSMRMVPVGQLFQRTARQIRDLSRKVGKQVALVTRGEDIEVDKTIAEALADPIMHMVRNSVDHGIETPVVRATSGKAPQATITLAAYHQGGQIVIEVNDDGAGMDREKILAKARERGLIEEGSHLAGGEVYRLILEPGFSTAERITEISGRGVGMDVVRRQVEKLRGRIEIRTVPGRGTTFLLRLPLTLAMSMAW